MDYYKDIKHIAQVDSNDTILGKIERWEAHEKGILHRAITVAVFYQEYAILQHRKHPVFDNVFDLTISSHQLYEDTMQSDEEAIEQTLRRELDLAIPDLEEQPRSQGSIMYNAKDPQSKYIEHEVCHIYTCRTKTVPRINLDFAYGYSLQKMSDIINHHSPLHAILAPWVKEMIREKKI